MKLKYLIIPQCHLICHLELGILNVVLERNVTVVFLICLLDLDHKMIPVSSESHLFVAFPPVQMELTVILALPPTPLLMLRMRIPHTLTHVTIRQCSKAITSQFT